MKKNVEWTNVVRIIDACERTRNWYKVTFISGDRLETGSIVEDAVNCTECNEKHKGKVVGGYHVMVEDDDESGYFMCENREQLEAFAIGGDWDSADQLLEDVGMEEEDLLNCWIMIAHNRVYDYEGE